MFYKLEEKSGGFWLKTYHSSNGDGLENLVYDDSSVEDIWIILSLENKLLAVVRVVIDGDGIGKIVVTDVDEEDTGLWLIVGVVKNEENVVLDESEFDWSDVLSEVEGDAAHVGLVEGMDNKRGALVGLGSVKQGLFVLADAVSVDEINSSNFLYLTILVDIGYCSLREFGHVKDSAFLVLWVVAHPVEEIEFWVNFEGGAPLSNNLSGLEVVDL